MPQPSSDDGSRRTPLARLRAIDRTPGLVNAVRRARRALPGDPGFGDPLSAGGDDSAARLARLAERVFDEHPRASHEVSLAALQLWHSVLERTGRGQGERELTILFTDLVGFSSWSLQAGDERTLVLLREVARAIEPPVTAHRGNVVKRLGDGVMAVFPAPQLAFDAVVAAQRRLASVELDGYTPRMRAGLHTGHPRGIGGDFLGVDVTVAARLVEKAGPDEILVSGTTLHGLPEDRVETRRKKTFLFRRVKGVPENLDVYVATPRH